MNLGFKSLTCLRITPGERIPSGPMWAAAQWIVIDDATGSSDSTSSRARIGTPVLVTSSRLRALGVHDAFRLAVRRCTHEGLLARAHSLSADSSAQAVGPARRWTAGVCNAWLCVLNHRWSADRKGIPDESRLAGAGGNMVDDRALGLNTAYPWTGVLALVANTGLVRWTVRAEDAFWLAPFVRVSSIVVDADARTHVVPLLADGIWSAG